VGLDVRQIWFEYGVMKDLVFYADTKNRELLKATFVVKCF